MIRLYPRLPRAVASLLANERGRMTVAEVRELAKTSHGNAIYATTGGARIQDAELAALRASVRAMAERCGYPEPRSPMAQDRVDGKLGRLLHEHGGLTPSEACRDEVWNFLGCVLLPDFVRWRFPGEQTAGKNFLGKDRGIDNALGRCWWAAELLREDTADDPYELLLELGVDETVGFTRRSRAVVNRRVATSLARTVVTVHAQGFDSARLELMRDAMKRFLRLAALTSFESLNDEELRVAMWDIVDASARHVAKAKGHGFESSPPPELIPSASSVTQPVAETPPSGPTSHDDELSSVLARIEIDFRSPNRFDPLKTWMGDKFGLAAEQLSIKRLTDAKNYRNRIGESFRHHPALSMLLHDGDTATVLTAVESRLHLSPSTIVTLCNSRSREGAWVVHAIVATKQHAMFSVLAKMFPRAALHVVTRPASESVTPLPDNLRSRLSLDISDFPVGEPDIVDTVQALVSRVTRSIGGSTRVKRITDTKNAGNRLSEGLGTGASALILATPRDLLETMERQTREQLAELSAPPFAIILAEDDEGNLAAAPVVVSTSMFEEDEDEDENEDEDEETRRIDTDDASDDEVFPVGFLKLDTLEDQAVCVAQHLLFHGPLAKADAVRLAARAMRDAGQLQYQRLRTNGRIFNAIGNAIEAGVRAGDLDRPRRGMIRSMLETPEEFTKEDWVKAVTNALPLGEAIGRDDVVRATALWARENLGLQYQRIRRNGKIDKAVRNAIRTLIRRGHMEANSQGEIILVTDATID